MTAVDGCVTRDYIAYMYRNYHDRSTKSRKEFNVGQRARVQSKRDRVPGVIIREAEARPCLIRGGNGREYIEDIRFILKCQKLK